MAASSSTEAPLAGLTESTEQFAKLGPLDRLKRLARTEPVNFASTLIGIPGSIYLFFRSISAIFPVFAVWLSINAKAEPIGGVAAATANGRDPLDWFVAMLMAVALVASLGAALFAQNAKKIDFGKDMTKLIVGFAVGFLSGGKVR